MSDCKKSMAILNKDFVKFFIVFNKPDLLSQIDYCNVLQANASNKDLKPLQKTLNDAVYFIFDLKWNVHVTPYLIRLHFLPFNIVLLLNCVLLPINYFMEELLLI